MDELRIHVSNGARADKHLYHLRSDLYILYIWTGDTDIKNFTLHILPYIIKDAKAISNDESIIICYLLKVNLVIHKTNYATYCCNVIVIVYLLLSHIKRRRRYVT